MAHDDDDDDDDDADNHQSALPFALQQQLDLLQFALLACLLALVVPNQETRLSILLLLG